MTEQMKPSGIEWIGDIPKSWKVTRLQTLFDQVKDKNSGTKEKNLLSLSYGKIVKKDIEGAFGLIPESFDTYNIIKKNDIVLRLTDMQNDQVSLRTGLVKEEKGIITSAYVTIRLKCGSPSYYHWYLYTEKPAELNIEKSNTQKQNIYGSSTDSIPFRDCAADCLPEWKGRDAMSLTEIESYL